MVGDKRSNTLDTEAGAQMYVPYAQDSGWGSMSLVIRTSGDPTSMAAAVRNEIRSLEKGIPVYNLKTMNDVLMISVGPRRTPMLLLSAFAGVALLLAMIGIYGVTAYYVTERTQEIGIRMALGAQMGDVMKLVLKGGMMLALVGIGLGLVGANLLTRLMTSLLFGVGNRCRHFCRRIAVSSRHGTACMLPAGATSDESGSVGGASVRIGPIGPIGPIDLREIEHAKLIEGSALRHPELIKRPGFTAAAVITLALGIGASTAIFTVVDAALLRGLPYKSPDHLYHVWESTPQKEFAQREFSYPDYQDYQQNQVFEGIAAYTGGGGI